MNRIEDYLKGKKKIAIAGHVSPDGDCIGSVMGLKIYLNDNFPEIDTDVYFSYVSPIYEFIKGIDEAKTFYRKSEPVKYDMLVLLDISSHDRIGVAHPIFEADQEILCIDHHITNKGTYTYFVNDPHASSASEVLYRLLDHEKISKECAEALYMGIAHDTGVFRYSCTSPQTMRIAADLIEKGIDFPKIIDETYYEKTLVQQRTQGFIVSNSRTYLDGQFIIGSITKKEREQIGARSTDVEGIVSCLRDTQGVEAAMLMHELDTGEIKVSMRSKSFVDVSAVCLEYGGGGHIRAAGFKVPAGVTMEDISEKTIALVKGQLEAHCS